MWQEPVFGVEQEEKYERWVTVSTRDPTKACSTSTIIEQDEHVSVLGDRLMMNSKSGSSGTEIPTKMPEDPEGSWKRGACMPNMSQHWGKPLDGDVNTLLGLDHGTHVLPINPMYSVVQGPGQGRVTALAFFTTEPQITRADGGVWDASGTAAQLCAGNYCVDQDECEYGPSNSVLHVFFIDQWSEPAQCGSTGSPGC
jgi:hypothetical protein